MPVEGEYMQRHDSGVKLRRKKFKWVDPGLIELSRARKRVRGFCFDGSGNFDCDTGTGASFCFGGMGG